jgi:hypothetical protein
MELDTAAASGQATDNAGQTNAITLDDAINAAFGASEGKAETSEPKAQDAKPEAATNAGDDAAGEKPVGEDVKATEGEKPAAPTEAPKHWPENRRQTFAKMPPEVQADLLALDKDLQGGFTRKSQELSDKARLADSVRGLFDDGLKSQLQRAGLDEVGAISQLLRLQQMATRDPVAYAKWFIENAGITPDHLGFPQTKQPDPVKEETPADPLLALLNPQPDPIVKTLQAELARLSEDVSGLTTAQKQARLQEEQARQFQFSLQERSINKAVREFWSAQDDHGQLKYPHFETLSVQMGHLMSGDPELSAMPDGPDKLAAAYDRAMWARPDLRQSLLEQEASKRVAEARKKEEAERAKRTVVKGGTNAPTASSKPQTLDDIIANSMAQHGAR